MYIQEHHMPLFVSSHVTIIISNVYIEVTGNVY